MDVIVHQRHVIERRLPSAPPQQVQVVQPVPIIEAARQPAVVALHDVLRDTRQIESRRASHATGTVGMRRMMMSAFHGGLSEKWTWHGCNVFDCARALKMRRGLPIRCKPESRAGNDNA